MPPAARIDSVKDTYGSTVVSDRRDGGQDEITLRVLEVDTKKTLPDAFPKGQYFAVEPTPDNKTVYYSFVTPDGPRAFVHRTVDDQVTLYWVVSGAAYVIVSPDAGAVRSASVTVAPARSTTYALYATNAFGCTSATVSVTVH